jgi:hypothetical protein
MFAAIAYMILKFIEFDTEKAQVRLQWRVCERCGASAEVPVNTGTVIAENGARKEGTTGSGAEVGDGLPVEV